MLVNLVDYFTSEVIMENIDIGKAMERSEHLEIDCFKTRIMSNGKTVTIPHTLDVIHGRLLQGILLDVEIASDDKAIALYIKSIIGNYSPLSLDALKIASDADTDNKTHTVHIIEYERLVKFYIS